MKRIMNLCIKALLVSSILAALFSNAALASDGTIEMVVSPNILSIESNGGSISIHTNIGYVAPEDAALVVNGTTIEHIWTFLDDRGNLVVKCRIDEVKDIFIEEKTEPGRTEEEAVFALTANYDGGTYTGFDTIKVIQVIPSKS
ncbi:hypothetical protein ACFLUP_00065 [Chloroflexota bacterium]